MARIAIVKGTRKTLSLSLRRKRKKKRGRVGGWSVKALLKLQAIN
jgi:hypothetical protein